MSNKRLLKSTGVIGLATLSSRILGFIRDIIIANFFGTTMFAEAFVISFRIPNLLRDLIGEGAANAAFVPVLTEYHTKHSREEFWNLARNLLYILAVILFIISLCGIIFAPLIVKAIAPGFMNDAQKLDITINLTRMMFPFIFLIGLVAYGMGVLNSLNHFIVPALGPALLNISIISFTAYYMWFLKALPSVGVKILALAVLVGGALQVISMGAVLYRKGLRIPGPLTPHRPKGSIFQPAIKKIWRLMVPRFFGSAVYQLSVIVDNIFSTFEWIVGAGAPAALWYSYRLFHLPLAIFGISLATVALPKMSKEVALNDISAFRETINFSMRSVFLVLIPASIGLATLGKPIITALFQRGEFTAYSTLITQDALFFYSFGLFACGGIKILVNSFFSLGDTKTPVKTASVAFFINLVLNYALMWRLKIGGLALATSIAATFNFLALYVLLVKKIGDIGTEKMLKYLARILLAGFAMGVFSYFAGNFLSRIESSTFINIIGIIVVMLLSAAIYVLTGLALGVKELNRIIGWIFKKG